MQQKLHQSSCECRNSSCSRTIESGGGVDVDGDAILFAKVLYSSSMMFLRNSIGSVYGFVYVAIQQVAVASAVYACLGNATAHLTFFFSNNDYV